MSPLDGRAGAGIGQVVPCVLVGAALALMPALGVAGEPGPASLSACPAEPPGRCGDTALPRLETSVALAYRQAAGRVQADPSLLAELGREQASFLQNRETMAAGPGTSLARYMWTWRQWLDAIAPARPGWEGTWITGSGSLAVTPQGDDAYALVARADDPIRGSYTCEFRGIGKVNGTELEVAWHASDDEEDGADGWTLHLRRQGGLLRLDQRRNASDARTPPFCGVHGSLEGAYLPAHGRPEPVTAWEGATDAP